MTNGSWALVLYLKSQLYLPRNDFSVANKPTVLFPDFFPALTVRSLVLMSGAGAGGAAAGAGAGGANANGGAGAGPPVAGWIDSDLLEEECEESVCGLCFGVMVEPASACVEVHSFCRGCYVKALVGQKKCPACRRPVADESKLARNRQLEGIIGKLRLRCEHGEKREEAGGPPAAKRAKLEPAASMTVQALRKELRQRGLKTPGTKPELVARLEEDRQQGAGKQGAGCGWRGRVGELAAHLGVCEWAPVKCPNGCAEPPLRRDLAQHDATCGSIQVTCSIHDCGEKMERRLLAEHEGSCTLAKVECPNEGCSVLHMRGAMNLHREKCEHEEVACSCPGCDARLLRKDMDAHFEATHLGPGVSAVKLLQSAYDRIAALQAVAESEQGNLSPAPTTWVFNWRADGWKTGHFSSEPHSFGGGVTGQCVLLVNANDSPFVGFEFKGIDRGRVHATFSIIDKHDKTLRQVGEIGTAHAPKKVPRLQGRVFAVTAEEKAQSVRADGSIRMRAVVRLFLDAAA